MDAKPSEFGAAAAKANFSELLARAEAGETITIRRHGRPVARLVPARRALTREERLESLARWEEYRRTHDIRLGPDVTAADLVREGRKHE
ncbi:MAG: type II toxin-antitoxin system Phd/YefM family antitoxin [Allosphingosinicella sp.]|uniref:type II toxin-antitoxin system Phd/YefM family antitoxin n=1 Tax=Allosphingosinicella sp. TaxID=2823234 RepID=UPI0039307BF0